MSDIGVYVRAEVLTHKQQDGRSSDGRECFWEFPTIPTDMWAEERFWFAASGRWQGYFIIDRIESAATSWCVVYFDSDSWHNHDGGPRRAFQGFTYDVPKVEPDPVASTGIYERDGPGCLSPKVKQTPVKMKRMRCPRCGAAMGLSSDRMDVETGKWVRFRECPTCGYVGFKEADQDAK